MLGCGKITDVEKTEQHTGNKGLDCNSLYFNQYFSFIDQLGTLKSPLLFSSHTSYDTFKPPGLVLHHMESLV